ncbi:sulfatase [Ideonella sp. 4Y16]|uniref:sulfatase family protein n=1 Tax=Ideonella alba TaxID=2824118 RepID=UPI001B3585AB|nr:sulfatase [Ideonella alba]MBQ0941818.1 sulfatase [Ideonella alba]
MTTRLLAGCLRVLGLAVLLVASAGATPRPPNIVFILTDDMDAELLQHLPRLQSLMVQQGMSFNQHFVSLSACCPSRSATLRGQFAHNTGMYANKGANGGFDKFFGDGLEQQTLATSLQAAGYVTALMGKYLNGYPSRHPGNRYIPPGWSEWAVPNHGSPARQYNYALNVNGQTVRYDALPSDYLVDVLTRRATRFIRQTTAERPDAPFFLYVSPLTPHFPSVPPRRYRNLFPDAKAPRPPSFNEADVSDKPGWLARRDLLPRAQVNLIDALYRKRLRSMLAVEDMVEQVMQTLKDLAIDGRTYVFFTSDNGYHLGQHRLPPGKGTEFDEDLRVPLLVTGPGVRAGSQVTQLTANVDYAATIAELAGIAPLPFNDGRSLVPLLKRQATGPWRDALLLEHAAERGAPRQTRPWLEPLDPGDSPAPAPMVEWRSPYIGLRLADNRTYIEYESGEREYYDMNTDPHQLSNGYARLPAAEKARLSAWARRLAAAAGQTLRDAEVAPPISP